MVLRWKRKGGENGFFSDGFFSVGFFSFWILKNQQAPLEWGLMAT